MQRSILLKKTCLVTALIFCILHLYLPCSGDDKKHSRDYKNNITRNNQDLIFSFSDYLALNNNYFTLTSAEFPDEHEKESSLRRFEISFFISAPFVFALTFITLHTYGVIKQKSTNVNVWKDNKPALLIGTFGISSAIATREALISMKENSKKDQTSSDRVLYLYASKNF
jgi:hypothetical protein